MELRKNGRPRYGAPGARSSGTAHWPQRLREAEKEIGQLEAHVEQVEAARAETVQAANAGIEEALGERAEALQARDEARAAAAAGDSELTRARTMLLVAEATARDAAARRREDQASLDELNARLCAYETRVSEMQTMEMQATHDARIELDVVNARLESAERRAALAESRLAEAAAARDEEREELIKELAATRAAATSVARSNPPRPDKTEAHTTVRSSLRNYRFPRSTL